MKKKSDENDWINETCKTYGYGGINIKYKPRATEKIIVIIIAITIAKIKKYKK